jgi:hypothetical protein
MSKSLAILSAFCFAQIASAAERSPLTLKQCAAMSSEVNKSVPMPIDSFTTLETTFCVPGTLKPVMTYRAVMGAPKDKLRDIENGLVVMKKQQINSWCTDPEQLKIIQVADVKNIYYDINRAYVGEIDIGFQDCQLLKR